METPVESLESDFAGFSRDGLDLATLFCVGCYGFLDQDVFARSQGFYRPLRVEAVGEGDVDCVDVGVLEDFGVGAVGLTSGSEIVAIDLCLGFGFIASSYGGDCHAGVGEDGIDNCCVVDGRSG